MFTFIRKILALPYLPAEHIVSAFEELSRLATQGSSEQIDRLLCYVNTTWIQGTVWKPENWSVFRQTVRTNNDVEGWHRGLNSRANGNSLPFYVLVPLLHNEAKDVTVTVRLVSENLVTRNQRLKYKRIHGRLFDLWDKYEDEDEYTTSKLLREASRLAGLGPIPTMSEDGTE